LSPEILQAAGTLSIAVTHRLLTGVAVGRCNAETSWGGYPYLLPAKEVERTTYYEIRAAEPIKKYHLSVLKLRT